jgi:hypothetical protein
MEFYVKSMILWVVMPYSSEDVASIIRVIIQKAALSIVTSVIT